MRMQNIKNCEWWPQIVEREKICVGSAKFEKKIVFGCNGKFKHVISIYNRQPQIYHARAKAVNVQNQSAK